MKHTFRNIFIYCISFLGIVFLYRLWVGYRGPLVRVVAFHDVENAEWFESVIKLLVTTTRVISPTQFHVRDFKNGVNNVLLTFDDGYESWTRICLPILEKYDVRAIFFLNTGPLDGVLHDAYVKDTLQLSPKTLLTWDGARTLVDAGHTIGGHTTNHPHLTALKQEEIEGEVRKDKERLSEVLQLPIVDFAYPFGTVRDYSKGTEELIRKEGYTFVYTAESSFVGELSKHIPRTLFEKNQSLASITLWLKGGYDVFAGARRLLRTFS